MSTTPNAALVPPLGDNDEAPFIAHDRRVVVDGIETQYLEAGHGPPCCSCTVMSRVPPVGGGSSPRWAAATACWR